MSVEKYPASSPDLAAWEKFASAALMGYLSASGYQHPPDRVARDAAVVADTMMGEWKQRHENP